MASKELDPIDLGDALLESNSDRTTETLKSTTLRGLFLFTKLLKKAEHHELDECGIEFGLIKDPSSEDFVVTIELKEEAVENPRTEWLLVLEYCEEHTERTIEFTRYEYPDELEGDVDRLNVKKFYSLAFDSETYQYRHSAIPAVDVILERKLNMYTLETDEEVGVGLTQDVVVANQYSVPERGEKAKLWLENEDIWKQLVCEFHQMTEGTLVELVIDFDEFIEATNTRMLKME